MGLEKLFDGDQAADSVLCMATGSTGAIDVVQPQDSTKWKFLQLLMTPYSWMAIESHLSEFEFLVADGHMTAAEIANSSEIGQDFFWLDWCHSGNAMNYDHYGQTWNMKNDCLAVRLLLEGVHRGLLTITRGSTGADRCQLDVFYDAVNDGLSVGQALRKKLEISARKWKDNEPDKCTDFEFAGFTTMLYGDPFLVPRVKGE